jgi:hypothetical protein
MTTTDQRNEMSVASNDRVQLWRRVGDHFIVEGRLRALGVWIPITNQLFSDYADAERALEHAMKKGGWQEARVVEMHVTTVATAVHSQHREVILRVPEHMKLTGERGSCPVCLASSPLANDGRDTWVFCATCSKALPWRG